MAGYISGDTRKVTTHRLVEMKQRGEKISMLTSYDYTTAQIVDGAGECHGGKCDHTSHHP